MTDIIKEQQGKISTGKAFSAGLSWVGFCFDLVNNNAAKAERKAREKGEAAKAAMTATIVKVDEVKALCKSYDKLTNVQLLILLAPLNRSGDKMPTFKTEMLTRLIE